MKQLQTLCVECAPEIIDNQFFVCYPESPSHVTYRARLEGTSERGSDSLISLIEDWVRGGPGVIVTGVLMTVDSNCSVAISSLSERECLPPPTDPPTTNPPNTDTTTEDSSTEPPVTDPPDSPNTDSPNATTEDPNTEEPPVTDPITDPTATVIGGIETPDTGATSETTTTTGIIAGGVVAVVIALIIAITIAVIAYLVLKSRRGEFAMKKSDRKYVHYCTLYLHLYDFLFLSNYTLKWNLSSMDTNEAE